ncbi:hypothetical protein GW17_00062255 [Ensete ventricosum]|nr:hypothetical protein GW17_00062255 [Ensete ventricosum]
MWYNCLRPSSIFCFDQLAKEFELNVLTSARPRLATTSLLEMSQKDDELLAQFVVRFAIELQGMPDAHPSLVIQAFMIRLHPSCFFWSLAKRPPMMILEMLKRANQYVAAEALVSGSTRIKNGLVPSHPEAYPRDP